MGNVKCFMTYRGKFHAKTQPPSTMIRKKPGALTVMIATFFSHASDVRVSRKIFFYRAHPGSFKRTLTNLQPHVHR
jgi:hypothetical protein